MQHNTLMVKLLQWLSSREHGEKKKKLPYLHFKGESSTDTVVSAVISSSIFSASEEMYFHTFLLSVLMSRFILNAWWWITRVMNSIKRAISETDWDTELRLTHTCSSLEELLTLAAEWKRRRVYINGFLQPILNRVRPGDMTECVSQECIIIWEWENHSGYSACSCPRFSLPTVLKRNKRWCKHWSESNNFSKAWSPTEGLGPLLLFVFML